MLLGLCTVATTVLLFSSCSSTKYVPDDGQLLKSVKLVSDNKNIDMVQIEANAAQRTNTKWFSLFKIPLGIYSLSGRDTTKWINRTLRRMGDAPVVYDSALTSQSCQKMMTALQNMGYLRASVDVTTKIKRKNASVVYSLHPGEAYQIGQVTYEVQDSAIGSLLKLDDAANQGLKPGMRFSVDNLEAERKRIAKLLLNNGYYRFNKDFIRYEADSTAHGNSIDLTLILTKYRINSKSPETDHPRYTIGQVLFSNPTDEITPLRRRVLENNCAVEAGDVFRSDDLQRTYNNFARLQAVRYTNIRFVEHPDSNLLDCNLQISTAKPNTISFQPEGTNTAGDLGAAASLTYENRNLFHGSEVLSIQLRAAYEAIRGLDGYQNQDYEEYNIETKLQFPRFIAPFLSKNFRRRSNARSEMLFSYNLQNRPEFHRRVFTSAWRYHWNTLHKNKTTFRLDLLDLNYVYMPWISQTFKENYLDNSTSRNAILKYNYEDLFIMKTGLSMTYNDGSNAVRANVEAGGNLLSGLAHVAGLSQNADGQYTLFNIAFAQYAKADFDYTRLVNFDSRNALALHVGLGIAYPYGNSTILPFEKRYFSGGANSVRGWSVRELGPGKYRRTDGRIDFINQTGDMKLDLNLEYRTLLFWKFSGAVFVDAGNIWTLRDYEDQPGGQFKLTEFYKELAMAYGLGIRFNLDYFVLRVDLGMKAVNPVYDNSRDHFPITHPNLGRDLSVHFAVGLPF